MKQALPIFISFLLFLFGTSLHINAQILIGDTLDMSNMHGLKNDTTVFLEIATVSKEIPPMTIGLVLSGGGAKGLAHVGVLKVLEREGIPVDYVGGTSMGGLVGGLYSIGYTPSQLEEIILKLPWSKLLSDEKERRDLPLQEKENYDSYLLSLPFIGFIPGLPKGLKAGQLIVNLINRLTWEANDIRNFEDLPTPFFCVATDLETGEAVLIDKGDLSMALRSTMSIPSIFAPVDFEGRTVVDGGLVNNYPVNIMMAKGIDYVIGVDVGAPLYKSEEISSVIDILDQISSFHQQERHRTNVRLTDLYIKPDIEGLTAMTFEDVAAIIKRGEDAAMTQIDQIRKLASQIKNQKRPDSRKIALKMSDTIFISRLEVENLNKVSPKLIEGRLNLHLPGANSIASINSAIDRLYSSNYFEFINYKLIKEEEGYVLYLIVEEDSRSLFNVGARYTTDIGASLLLDVQLMNKLLPGSRLDLSLRVGSNPGGGIRYLIDRGSDIGLGVDVNYSSHNVNTYSDDFESVVGKYFLSFTSGNIFMFSNYSNNSSLLLGGSIEYQSLVSEISAVPINYKGTPFFNLFAEYIIDSYDNQYYPHKGIYFSVKPVVITQYNEPGITYINTEARTVINFGDHFSMLPSAFLGMSWGGLTRTGYFYSLGGAGYNRFKNMVSFNGLPMSASFSNNLLLARLNFRFQFFKKHYILFKTNIASESVYAEELLINSTLSYGGGIAYSLNSLVGPIELGVNLSNRQQSPSVFFNIGLYF